MKIEGRDIYLSATEAKKWNTDPAFRRKVTAAAKLLIRARVKLGEKNVSTDVIRATDNMLLTQIEKD